MERLRLKPALWDVIPLSVAVLLAFTPVFLSDGEPECVRVIIGGETAGIFSLDNDTVFTVESRTGPLVISISDGYVSVVSASCPHKICVKTGAVSRPGQSIICAPGRVAVIIEGKGDLDGLTR